MAVAHASSLHLFLVASLINEACSVAIMTTAVGIGAGAAATAGTMGTVAATGTTTSVAAGTAAAGAATAGAAAAGTASAGAVTTAWTGAALTGSGMAVFNFLPAAVVASPLVVGLGTVVGAEADAFAVTWDCWKPMLHDRSTAPSRGRHLEDLLNDPAITEYHMNPSSVFVRNRWNESWRIDPLILPWGQVAAHASQVVSTSSNSSADLGGISSRLYPMNTTVATQPQVVTI
eukprot:TRINITY_DN2143_c0_g1_i5.p1 TRINITY_DN2143_c0_g1~~TRINITY_DN2143_c0_g1_i5.p1  ORF type:complete len:261 (+),score=27.47 TRINITY_DN2143_c0_g1_i5:88-783(+)